MKTLKVILLTSLLALIHTSVSAQSLTLLSADGDGATLTFTTPEPTFSVQQVQGQPYTVVALPGAVPSSQPGAPDLPIVSQMVEIPLCSDVKAIVTDVQVLPIGRAKHPLMPVQPPPCKSQRAPLPLAYDSALYAHNGYYSLPPATIQPIGVARDRNLALLRLSPLSYNPVTGQMQLIRSMTVKLQYKGVDMAATERMHTRYHSPDYAVGQHLLRALPEGKAVRLDAPLHYLIISHSSFRGALDSFVNWKKRQGMLVTVAYTDDPAVGTTSTSIANYIKSYYTQATPTLPAPTYLLLVGDHQQIPAFNSQRPNLPLNDHVTDLYFATWTDGDIIPDCHYGRFSARNLSELTPQIEKTLYYEQYGFTDDSYLGRGILIAGQDQGVAGDNAYRFADPAMDYIAAYYINAGNGYNDVRYYKNNTTFAPTGVTVTGNSQTANTASTLLAYYSSGCGWVNYSAHGYDNEWSTPNFSTTHVASMTNKGKPSVMIGNCCLSGKFNTSYYDACLGEALLRKGENAGAVMYIGGTNSTYWPHDFCWSVGVRNNISNTMNPAYDASHLGMYDRLFHTHRESFSAWHTTAGSMVMAGNTAVQEYSSGGYADYYWEIYELFGDPSLMPWLGTASDMTVDAASTISIGSESYTIEVAPHAYVALVDTTTFTLIAAAYANASGHATLALPSDLSAGTYQLSVWAQNYKPYFQQVSVVVLDGPYIMVTSIAPSNGSLKPGQISTFDISVANIGTQLPTLGLIHLESLTDGVMPIQPVAHFNSIAPGDTVQLTGVWPTYVSESLTDGVKAKFTATVEFGPGTSTKKAEYAVNAPSLAVVDPWLSPELQPDSTSIITCQLVNRGSDTSNNTTITLPNLFGFMVDDAAPVPVGRLAPNDIVNLSIPVTMVASLPNTTIPFHLIANDSCGSRLLQVLSYRAGGSQMEDFETGTLTKFNWIQNSNPWEITSSNPYAGAFSARSKSDLGSRRESRMSINWTSTLDDSISFYYKVSSEEGYDKFTFYIDGVEMISASGEVDWTLVSFPVRAGAHIFGFSYTKDYYTVAGSDCAWIDNVSLPFAGELSRFVVDTVCQNNEYNFGSLDIPTEHTGTFNYSDTLDGQMAFLSLMVSAAPQVSIQVIGTPAIGECVLLKATGADSYVWNTGDSTAFISVCPQSSGEEYTVEGCRAGCCGSNSVTFDVLGLDDRPGSQSVTLYPNPAHGQVTVQAEQMRKLEIINIVGQSVLRKNVTSSSAVIDLQGLPKGIYFVKVETAMGMATEKLVLR